MSPVLYNAVSEDLASVATPTSTAARAAVMDFPDTRNPMLTGHRDAVLIYNPAAGGNRRIRMHDLDEARRILADSGIDAELQATTGPGSASQQACEAVARGK